VDSDWPSSLRHAERKKESATGARKEIGYT
jgi:hypothetical protein